jgi:hypothetical protein
MVRILQQEHIHVPFINSVSAKKQKAEYAKGQSSCASASAVLIASLLSAPAF